MWYDPGERILTGMVVNLVLRCIKGRDKDA